MHLSNNGHAVLQRRLTRQIVQMLVSMFFLHKYFRVVFIPPAQPELL